MSKLMENAILVLVLAVVGAFALASLLIVKPQKANGQETVEQMFSPMTISSIGQSGNVELWDGNLNLRILKLTKLRLHDLEKFDNIYGKLESVDEKEPELKIDFGSDENQQGKFVVDGMPYYFNTDHNRRFMAINIYSLINIRAVDLREVDLHLTAMWLPDSQRVKINLPINEANTKNKADAYVALLFKHHADFKQYTPYDYDYDVENGNIVSVRVSYKQKEQSSTP